MTTTHAWDRELRHSWPLLKVSSTTGIATAPLPLAPSGDSIRIGIDGTGARHLLIPICADRVRGDDTESALTARIRTYTFASTSLQYLDIICVRSDLFDLFDEVLIDILTVITARADGSPARSAVEVVGRWRALLSTRRASLLTLAAQMALFAELSILEISSQAGHWQAEWWRGPLREPQDIRLPGCAMEVKAIGPGASSIEIHGLSQLEPPGVPLALVVVEIDEVDNGNTLPELIERVVNRADDRSAAVRLLVRAGYSPGEVDRYDQRLAIRSLAMIEVTEEVPQIVPAVFGVAGVPVGLHGVVYRIELDALESQAVRGSAALMDWLAGL